MTKEELEIAKAACCVGTIWDEYEGKENFDHMVGLRVKHLIELVRYYQQSSLPSNLDEAAEEVMPISYGSLEVDCYGGSEPVYSREQMVEIFKAGAEWMAEQVMMLKWKHPEEKYQYPECLTRIMDEYGDWHYTISEGHLNPDCEYISLAELSLRLATR